jgi:hypothetical protein
VPKRFLAVEDILGERRFLVNPLVRLCPGFLAKARGICRGYCETEGAQNPQKGDRAAPERLAFRGFGDYS